MIIKNFGLPIEFMTKKLEKLEEQTHFCSPGRCLAWDNHTCGQTDSYCPAEVEKPKIIRMMYDIADHRSFCVVLDSQTCKIRDIVRVSDDAKNDVKGFIAEYGPVHQDDLRFVTGIHNVEEFKQFKVNLDDPVLQYYNQNARWYNLSSVTFPNANQNSGKILRTMLYAGGSSVQLQGDCDDDILVERGEILSGQNSILFKMNPHECHWNACEYHKTHAEASVCTGYALSNCGSWYCHSWCIVRNRNEYQIIETTAPRVAYFGYTMTDQEAQNFFKRIS